MKEEAHPKIKGSRASSGDGPRGFASSVGSVRNSGVKVNNKFSVSEYTAVEKRRSFKDAGDYFGRAYK